MKSNTIFACILLFALSISLFAVENKTNPSFAELQLSRFNRQWTSLFQEKVYLHTDKPYYSAGECIWFKAYLVNATTNEPSERSRFVYVELVDQLDSVQSRIKLRSDSLGFQGYISLRPEIPAGQYRLRAYTFWMQNAGTDFFFTKNIFIGNKINERIPDIKKKTNGRLSKLSTEYDVQFFPQSGTFLNDAFQTIGFKAVGSNGMSIEVTGKVLSSKNEECCSFTTFHLGMGKFTMQTQPGESYHALVKSKDGIEKRVELPKTQQTGAVLNLLYNRGRILYEVTNHTGQPDNKLYLLLHSRGKLLVVQPLQRLYGQIAESELPTGIVSLAVVDSLGITYCERLTFVRNFKFPEMRMTSDKPVYGKRALVNLDFTLASNQFLPVNGDFSLSVTDSRTVVRDSLSDHIISNLLLCSDIKGYVEAPATYFADNKMETREKTDVLLLTQGWRRFKTAEVVKGIFNKPIYYLERGQFLSGKVLNLFNKPSKKCDIMMISPHKNLLKLTQTDSLGCYLIDGIEFPDSTMFVLKAKKPKSLTDVELIPDGDVFPKLFADFAFPTESIIELAGSEYFTISKDKYYFEGGLRAINLDEVTVTAEKKVSEQTDYYSGMADSEISAEQLERYPSMSIINLLFTIPGIQMNGNQISIRGASGNPLILLDNVEFENVEELTYLTPSDLESIQVFKGANAGIFGSRGGNGVIAIRMKKGSNVKTPTPISLARVTPLGYQKPVEFYVPKYGVDSIHANPNPDLRTTIYWNPSLHCDSTGVIHVQFYTADKANNYSVEVEGLTKAGEICRFEGVLKRRND